MYYPDYLVHFNPNHDPKTGQFTFSKYLNRDGSLSSYSKERYGINKIDKSPVRNINYKKAQKLIDKDLLKAMNSGARWIISDVSEYLADEKFKYDIENANKNKKLINDLRDGVKKYFELEKDDWDAAYDYQDELTENLKKKYPEFKNLLTQITIGETVNNRTVDKWLKSDKPFPDILNNDAYYEPSDLDATELKYVDDVINAWNKETTNIFINKYGKNNVPNEWLKYA